MVLCGTNDPNVGGWCRVVPNFFLFLGHIGYQVIRPKSPKIYGVGRWVHKFVPNKTVFYGFPNFYIIQLFPTA